MGGHQLHNHTSLAESPRWSLSVAKRMQFIMATNIVASQLPERRLTGTPHTRANLGLVGALTFHKFSGQYQQMGVWQDAECLQV